MTAVPWREKPETVSLGELLFTVRDKGGLRDPPSDLPVNDGEVSFLLW